MKPSYASRHVVALAAGLVALVVFASCGQGPSDERDGQVSRSRFIDAYVDLRVTALRAEEGLLTDSARAVVLERHGMTEDELLRFVDAHGRDLDYMRDLWNEVELRLDSVPPLPPDSQP
ncbi:MAG: hypothetical protein WD995_09450 [Gemmatimonadota bacterium]